jgi:chemotaxis protein histidine kinase CheA
VRFKHEIVPVLRNVFMHVFRNSIDHGIEAPEQRTALGKPAAGQIHLGVSAGDEEVTLTYEDDGKGLALERIYNKALAEGVMQADEPVTDEDIAALIFRSGLSTAEVVSTVSGRGVGMDAIKKFLQKYHGDIRLEFTGESTVAGFRPFRQIITLPARFAVRGE